MRKKEEKPDHLDKMAAAAHAAHMTYGKYKAMLWEEEKRNAVEAKALGFVPEGMRRCRNCGKLFKKWRSIAFCGDECRRDYQLEKKRIQSMEAYNRTRK